MKASTLVRSMLTTAACFFGATALASGAVTTYPYANGFESDTVDQLPGGGVWFKNGAGTTTVSNNTIAAEGSKAVCINDAALTLDVNSSANDKLVRVQLYCRPVRYDTTSGYPSLDTNGTRAAFIVNQNGYICASNGAQWVVYDSETPIPVGGWVGFLVALDYQNNLWDIYYTNGQYVAGSGFKRLNATPLTMSTWANNAELTNVTVSSGTSAYVDQFCLDRYYTELVTGQPSPASIKYLTSVVVYSGMSAQGILRCFDSTSDGGGQEAGRALAQAIGVGGEVRMYDPGTAPPYWNRYRSDGSQLEHLEGKLVDEVHFGRGDGIWITTARSGTYPIQGVFAPQTSTEMRSKNLYPGWNMLACPWALRAVNNGTGDNLKLAPSENDRICIYRAGQPYRTLTYKALKWREANGNVSVYELSEEQSFWLHRRGMTSPVWNPLL